MKDGPVVLLRRRVAHACALAALVFLAPGSAEAAVGGSKHDFSSLLTPARGSCGACHVAHFGQPGSIIWGRPLSQERDYFNQTADPAYTRGFTVLCYDCHDNHSTVDNDPPDGSFDQTRLPQDVAFDEKMKTTVPRDGLSDDNKPGYYENVPSRSIPPVTTFVSGHYVKSAPGAGAIEQGDKLPCSDCHDPHSTVNQAFMRPTLGGKAVTGKKASLNMAYTDPIKDDRNDADSREFCVACHGTSEQVAYRAVNFNNVNATYGSSPIVAPPASVSDHRAVATSACTNCHNHNSISASCRDCHGYPPLDAVQNNEYFDKTLRPNTENYAGGAGAHRRHRDALGVAIFQCEICHGPNPGSANWHNTGNGVLTNGDNVNIMGRGDYWDPDNTRTTDYDGTSNTPPPTPTTPERYEFSKTGGGEMRCSGLLCHGGPPDIAGALRWTDKMVDDTTGDPIDNPTGAPVEGLRLCKWCHDGTPARIGTGPIAPNVLGDNDGATGVWNTGNWGADVNGHGHANGSYEGNVVGESPRTGVQGADRQCMVCHDVRYKSDGTPYKTHFDAANDSAQKRLKGTDSTTINGLAAADADTVCLNCHQNGATGTGPEGTEVSKHGNDYVGNLEGAQGSMERSCRQCHNVHGANWNGRSGAAPDLGRNLHMIGTWVDADNDGVADPGEEARVDSDATGPTTAITSDDLRVVLTRNSGEDSYDDGAAPANDGVADSVCSVCHVDLVNNHNERGDVTTVRGTGHNPVGTDCTMCHDHDFDNAMATRDAFMPSGCNGCHGTNESEPLQPGAIRKQFWPDGNAVIPQYAYADNQAGAHLNHVATIAMEIYGETPAQLVTDNTAQNPTLVSADKQKTVCAFCHPDPGGAGHTANDNVRDPADRATLYLDADDATTRLDVYKRFTVGVKAYDVDVDGVNANQAYNYTTETCANLVCHNRAASPASPTGWNAPPAWAPPSAQCFNVTCHATDTHLNSSSHGAHVLSRTQSPAGSGYACTECHADNGTNLQHQNGEVDMSFTNAGSLDVRRGGATVAYYDKNGDATNNAGDTGFAYRNGSYANTCYNVYCHGADSTWGGADTTPVWTNAATATCYNASTCHNAYGSPYDQYGGARNAITSGSHAVHINQWSSSPGVESGTPRGPRLAARPGSLAVNGAKANCDVCHNLQPPAGTTDCGNTYCHSGTASGASLPTSTHADGTVDFIGTISGTPPAVTVTAATLAATTACNECHGGATPAATAKTNWYTPAWRAPCEDCHGDYTAARSRPNIGPPFSSVDAPTRAGTNFDTRGHGKVTANPTYGGTQCVNCHAETSQHFTQRDGDGAAVIAPALDDANRLDVLGGNDYDAAPVTYCGTCHSGTVETVHFDNTHTGGGTSDAAILCATCHDPHGQAGQDAMIVGSVPIGGTVSGFTDKTARASYANASFQGICQVCHDPAEVTTFNRSTDSSATHQPGGVCTSCHVHSNTVAFTARCADCHGDFLTETYFYPDSGSGGNPNVNWPNRAGKHAPHVTAVANFSATDSVVASNASTCGYCHPGGGHSGDHVAPSADLMNGTATHFLSISGLTDSGEVVTQAVNSVTCAGVNCHYNKSMAGADWYGAPSVTCAYCHADGVANYANGELPNAHDPHVGEAADGGRDFACIQCHAVWTSNAHQNGSVEVVFSATNTLGEPGVNLATATGSDGAVKYGQTGGGYLYPTCNYLFCHGADAYEDAAGLQLAGGTVTAPHWDVPADGDCGACHDTGTQAGETSPGTSIATGNHPAHLTAAYGPNLDESTLASSCDQCHAVYSATPYRATHVDGTVNFLNLDNATVTTLAATNTCDECHGASTANAKNLANWDNGSYLLPCIECHDATNPANSLRAGTGVNAPAKDATLWGTAGHGRSTGTYSPSGRSGANSTCPSCHAPSSAHISGTLADGDRLTTSGNALCNGCHDGAGAGAATTSVSTHGNSTTTAPTYSPQRLAFQLNCVECHDVHGTTNIYMVNVADPDGPLVLPRQYDGVDNLVAYLFNGTTTRDGAVAFTDHSVGTSSSSGIGFADTSSSGNASKICQTCHRQTVHFEFDSADTHFNSICVGCHPHEFDSNNTTQDGFMPKGDCEDCHDAAASNPPALAPKVMANWTSSGHGKTGIAAECVDCHNIGLPVPDTHLDNTVNSVWENGTVVTRNTNTAHLRADFFTPYTGNGSSGNAWDVQVTFDNFCWSTCHSSTGSRAHHNSTTSGNPTAHDYPSVQFGRLNDQGYAYTYSNGDRGSGIWEPSDWTTTPSPGSDPANAPYPIDCDLSTDANCADTDYAPCIACHDPHGTSVVQPGVVGGNRMLRRTWKQPSYLCRGCHPS